MMRRDLDQRIVNMRSEKLSQLVSKDFAIRLKAYVRLYTDENPIVTNAKLNLLKAVQQQK